MKNNWLLLDKTDKYGIKKLQNCILNIMDFVDKICRDHKINYYLMGGSALGAIRHNGFIPWDDDLDIFMTAEEYKKFKTALLSKKQSVFYLQEWGAVNGCDYITMAKVRDSSTTLIENALNDWNINHGVYIDIFILHKAGNDKFIKKQLYWSRYLVVKGLSTKHYWTTSFCKNIILFLLKLTPNRFLVKHALKIIYKYDFKNSTKSSYYFHFLGRAGLKQGLYPTSFFKKPLKHRFEKCDLCVPTELEKYIVQRWGENYMTPPSPEMIKHMQHPSFVDLDKSYTAFLNKTKKKKTEKKLIL